MNFYWCSKTTFENYSQFEPLTEILFPFSTSKIVLQDEFSPPSIVNQARSGIEEEGEAWMKPYTLLGDDNLLLHMNSKSNKSNTSTKGMIVCSLVEFPCQLCHSRLEVEDSRNLKPFVWLKTPSRCQRLYPHFQPPEPNSFGVSWTV